MCDNNTNRICMDKVFMEININTIMNAITYIIMNAIVNEIMDAIVIEILSKFNESTIINPQF